MLASCSGPAVQPSLPPGPSGPAPLRRLSDLEYVTALGDLFPDQHHTLPALPADTTVAGFENAAEVQRPSDVRVARYLEIARLYAEGYDVAAFPGVDALASRLFRRPLTAGETARLSAAFDTWSDQHGRALAVRLLVAMLLQSPQFLYRVEDSPLTAHQLASRLSFFLWQSVPDDALLAAAARGDVRSEVPRMLDDPRAQRLLWSFHRQWLGLDRVLTEEHATQLDQAAALLDTRTFVETSRTLPESLGVFTRVAFLAGTSHPAATSPPIRGNAIQSRLLCLPPVSPPPGADLSPPGSADGVTNRAQFEARTRPAACQGCHLSLNGIGFGFEHWSAVGTWQELDHGAPVDARGELYGTDVDGPFDGTGALLEKLGSSPDVKRCSAERWLRYALGRAPVESELPLIDALAATSSTRELLLTLVSSSAFTREAVQR